jgi:hypothetical protein
MERNVGDLPVCPKKNKSLSPVKAEKLLTQKVLHISLLLKRLSWPGEKEAEPDISALSLSSTRSLGGSHSGDIEVSSAISLSGAVKNTRIDDGYFFAKN